jgi:hypothetical protein
MIGDMLVRIDQVVSEKYIFMHRNTGFSFLPSTGEQKPAVLLSLTRLR